MWWNTNGGPMHDWGWHGFFAWPMLLFLVLLVLGAYGLFALGRNAGGRRRDPLIDLAERYRRGEIDDETFQASLKRLRDRERGHD